MKFTILITLTCLLASCGSGPVVRYPDGTTVIINPSVLEKSASEMAVVTMPDGLRVEYAKTGKDQTSVAEVATKTWGTVTTITNLADATTAQDKIKETGLTRRAGQQANLDRARSADAVKIRNFTPPEP